MKYLITFVFLTLSIITISCGVKLNELRHAVNHYDLTLDLLPENSSLKIKGRLVYISPEPLCDSAIFYLHKQFKIKSISGSNVAGYKFYSTSDSSLITNPDARILHVYFSRPINKGEETIIEFEYSGEINQINRLSQNVISKEWTEIGYNLPWFPYNYRHGEFTFNLNVICGSNYEVRSSVPFSKKDSGFYFSSINPTNNIPVIAAENIKEISTTNNEYNLKLYYTDIHDSTAENICKELDWILKKLTERFGNEEKKNFAVLQSMRDIGGSYSDLGMLSLSQLYDSTYFENRTKYFMQLSHAAAKLWWWQAAHDWNDWMNEGFAEFSAMLLLKERFGESVFSEALGEKEDSLSGVPPVWMFNREHIYNAKMYNTSNSIMNNKAPVLLFQLYKNLGSEKFNSLCREMIANDVSSTIIFLRLLEEREGKETADWFEEKLKYY